LISTVTSLGPDGVPSDDDIVKQETDLNKSKLIGRWAGQRFKQAKDGFIQGLKDKSPFKKKSQEKNYE